MTLSLEESLVLILKAELTLQPFVQLRLLITSLPFTWMFIFANL